MANARTCDGPNCPEVGPANPEGWLVVTVDTLFEDAEIDGSYSFHSTVCLENWLDQWTERGRARIARAKKAAEPKTRKRRPKRKGT